ncbi:hypothetical protein [Mucilaginibacter pedocola]|uniref:Uncharacterized protein n=1 Tax=Mucilaginibacter pedocola TaxID=1792845 RepID=A0A1S9PDY1_9SPHI|nr:hypothetical protein [Mucilaginibacter pedocola]OOQ59176.1 hypothetical protein BC343_28865 [Mucilaginibacter pedocola]
MNKALYFFILAALLTACKSKPAQQQPAKAAVPAKQTSLLKKLVHIYEGVWVKTDYFEKVRETKSVLAAVDKVVGVSGLVIDSNLLLADTLRVEVGWDNQNPGAMVLRDKPGKNPNSLLFDDAELGYEITGGDTALILYQIYNQQLFKTRYNRILPVNPDGNLSNALDYAINKTLMAGKYQLLAGGKTTLVTFTADGTVSGLPGHGKYFIEKELKPGPFKNLDLITFDEYSNKKAVYTYVFKGDELLLYDAKPDAKNKVMVMGQLKYTLKHIN